MLTHNQLPLTLHPPEDIRSIAFSPDDRVLAISGGDISKPPFLEQ